MNKEKLTINVLAIIACLLWSTAFTGVKIGLQYSSPLRFAGIRFFMAGLLLLPLALHEGNYLRIIRLHANKILIVAALQVVAQYILFYLGLNLVSGALGAILIGAGPLFIAIFAHFSIADDRLNWKKFLFIAIGFAGIVLVSLGRHQSGNSASKFLGILLLIGVNIASGVVNIFIKKRTTGLPAIVMSSTSMGIGGIIIFLVALPIEGMEIRIHPAPYYISLAWLSFVSATAFGIWLSLLKKPSVKVSELNFWKFLIPVFGALLAWSLLPDESPDIISLVGVVVTGSSLVLFNLTRRKLL